MSARYGGGMNPIPAKLTAEGTITIPPEVLASAKLQPGDVELEVSGSAILIRRPWQPRQPVDIERMRSVIGCWKDRMPDMTADEWLDETRGPVELPPDNRG